MSYNTIATKWDGIAGKWMRITSFQGAEFSQNIDYDRFEQPAEEINEGNEINIFDALNNRDYDTESATRAKQAIRDLIRLNVGHGWRFLTLTYGGERATTHEELARDIKEMVRRLEVAEYKDIKYIAIPEYHKDKIHLHLHLLINCDDYDNDDFQRQFWRRGFVKMVTLKLDETGENLSKIQTYLQKYITKNLSEEHKTGEKHYFSSRNLKRETQKAKYTIAEQDIVIIMQAYLRAGWVCNYVIDKQISDNCKLISLEMRAPTTAKHPPIENAYCKSNPLS